MMPQFDPMRWKADVTEALMECRKMSLTPTSERWMADIINRHVDELYEHDCSVNDRFGRPIIDRADVEIFVVIGKNTVSFTLGRKSEIANDL